MPPPTTWLSALSLPGICFTTMLLALWLPESLGKVPTSPSEGRCAFSELIAARRHPADIAQPHAGPFLPPVRLLDATSHSDRYAIGVVVRLKDGRKVPAFTHGSCVSHEWVLTHIKEKFGDSFEETLWWGEVRIQRGDGNGPGKITEANETSGGFARLRQENPSAQNNVRVLVEALQAIQPGLIDPTGCRHYADYATKDRPESEHLSPSLLGRHSINNVLSPLEQAVSRTLWDPYSGEKTSDEGFVSEFREWKDVLQNLVPPFENILDGLVGDGLISSEKRKHLSLELQAFLSSTDHPSRHLAEALVSETTALREKMEFVANHPEDNIEILLPPAPPAPRLASPTPQ